jgi:hypothetical protein
MLFFSRSSFSSRGFFSFACFSSREHRCRPQSQSGFLPRAGYQISFVCHSQICTWREIPISSSSRLLGWCSGRHQGSGFCRSKSRETSSSCSPTKKRARQLTNAPKPAHTTNSINSHPFLSPCRSLSPSHCLHSYLRWLPGLGARLRRRFVSRWRQCLCWWLNWLL